MLSSVNKCKKEMFATTKLSGKVFIYQLQDAVEYTLCSRLNLFDKQRNIHRLPRLDALILTAS